MSIFDSMRDLEIAKRQSKAVDRLQSEFAERCLALSYVTIPYEPRPTLALLRKPSKCAYCGGAHGNRRSCDGCGAS